MSIAYVTANLATSTSPTTVTVTVSGSSTFLAASLFNSSGSDDITAMTAIKGGIATNMTLIFKFFGSGTGEWTYCYGMLNPDAGSNTVTATTSSGTNRLHAAVYSGVSQSLILGSLVTNNGTNASVSGGTGTLTTPSSNDWTILFARGNGDVSAGTGSTERPTVEGTSSALFDSNGPVSGSTSMSFNGTSNGYDYIMYAIEPVASVSPVPFRKLLGVGI